MIATLASFATHFEPSDVENARQLFASSAITFLDKQSLTWNTEVNDGKSYKTSVRVEDGYVTDIYCTCRSGTCIHTMAVMFALKKKLKIKSEVFEPAMLETNPIYLVGPRINDLVYISRQAGSKDGELEKLGASVSLKKIDYKQMRSMVRSQLTGYDNSPIFNGAKKLLGAAILAIEEENYPPVFTVARAILTEICTVAIWSNSANECCRAAIALMRELYNLPNPSTELKEEVFSRVIAAWNMGLYAYFTDELIEVITITLQKKEHQEKALEKLESVYASKAVVDAEIRLLKLLGKPEESKLGRNRDVPTSDEELIEKAFARKDYREVKMIAYSHVEGVSPKEWWEWIYKVAMIENDISELRRYYVYQYFDEGLDDKYYDLIRASFTPSEWLQTYPGFLESFEVDRSISDEEIFALTHICVMEGLDDKLTLHFKRFPWYRHARLAPAILEKTCPDILEEILEKHFIQVAAKTVNRERTAALHAEMKYWCSTTWGRNQMMQIRTRLIELHPTWKVFQDELSKRF